MNLHEAFDEVYGGKTHIMTNRVIELGKISNRLIYEISKGRGICGGELWGVTFLVYDETNKKWLTEVDRHNDRLNRCFYSEVMARDHITLVKALGIYR